MGLNNDGEAVFVPAQENYKEAVKWMHMLWENGVFTWKDVETGEIWRTERIEK